MNTIDCDLLVIGAGPVGLYAAYYPGFRGLSTVVVDSLPEAGGQVSAMYPEKPIYDVAGLPAVKGRDLVAALVAQAGSYQPTFVLGEGHHRLPRQGPAHLGGLRRGRHRCQQRRGSHQPDERLFPGHSSDTVPIAA